MLTKSIHRDYLLNALSLAEIRKGFCAPNPSVGAIIVSQNGEILSKGYHLGPGLPHAEVVALNNLSQNHNLDAATMYVTLEPCCHTGRTPPCTTAIINSGIKNVIYGYSDPNPIVSGGGEDMLRAANVICEHISIPEIDRFYLSYQYWHKTKLPYVTAKIAMTIDGKIAGKNSIPIKITCDSLNNITHKYRKQHDAILTTAKTVILDNPQLNVRLDNEVTAKPLYILDGKLNLPLNAKVFSTASSITVFHSENIQNDKYQQLQSAGVRCIKVSINKNLLDLNEIIRIIGNDGVHELWVEAGGECFASFVKNNLVQRTLIYIAPHTVNEGIALFTPDFNLDLHAKQNRWEQVGQDVLCETYW